MSSTGQITVTSLQNWLDELGSAHGSWCRRVQLRAGSGHPCTLCRCSITKRDSEHAVSLQPDSLGAETAIVLRFHASCYLTWDRFVTATVTRRS